MSKFGQITNLLETGRDRIDARKMFYKKFSNFLNDNIKLTMQIDIPQILWHDQQNKLMSVDVYPNGRYFVTASYVTFEDSGIKFWELKKSRDNRPK